MAAGGLRRPPTKSPNRIPFGFRASLRRVNNVFTRRFGSFAVNSFFSPSLLVASSGSSSLYTLACPLVCSRFFGTFLIFSLIVRLCSCAACGRTGVLHVPRGCLQLRIMNIDNSRPLVEGTPFQCKYLGDLTGPRRSILFVLAIFRSLSFTRGDPSLSSECDLLHFIEPDFCSRYR